MKLTLQFTTPIAGAWKLSGDELVPVSIFDERNVPALSKRESEQEDESPFPHSPLLYVGE